MTTVAFIGLGIMGGPMAANLVEAGFDVVGCNRSHGPLERLRALGGRAAPSVAEAAHDADVVVTMLPDTPDVEKVLFGGAGVFASAPRDALVIDFSTISPEVAVTLAARASAAGMAMLDAPVSGGQQGAVDGTLSVMVGGDKTAFASASPLFEAVGRTIVHVGAAGSGQTVKAANQLIVAGTLGLVSEALVFLEASGVDTEAAVRVLSGGLADSAILKRKAGSMLDRDFTPGFRAELHHKDMGILLGAARAVGAAVPLGSVAAQLMGCVVARGDGSLDHSSLFRLVEQLSGRGPTMQEKVRLAPQ